jgi:hypothetical protein
MTTIFLGLLAVILCLDTMLIIATRILLRVERYIQTLGGDMSNFYIAVGRISKIEKQLYNARKRDEKILRRIHENGLMHIHNYMAISKRIDDLGVPLQDWLKHNKEVTIETGDVLLQKINKLELLVKKGNKDQQEIKTRLTGSRKRELKMAESILKAGNAKKYAGTSRRAKK